MKRRLNIFIMLSFIVIAALTLLGCEPASTSKPKKKSSANEITEFKFEKKNNAVLEKDYVGKITGVNISVTLPDTLNETNLTNLTATFITSAKTVSIGNKIQESGITKNNFAAPLKYIAKAENGDVKEYTVTVILKSENELSKENDILAFVFNEETASAVIEGTNISIEVVKGTDLTSLIPSIKISDDATISPASGIPQDFTSPVKYTVTAENGDAKEYTVTVTVAVSLSSQKDITSFLIAGQVGETVIDENDITLTMPAGTDLTKLSPVIKVSGGASVSPASGIEGDFTGEVKYTVTAQDGSSKEYKVNVSLAEVTTYLLTLTGDNMTSNPTAGQVASGTLVTVIVSPANGKRVAAFTVNGVDRKTELAGGTVNQYTFTMTTAITVVVTYEDIPVTTYLLTLTGDNMTSNPTAGQVASGTSVTVTVSPANGKRVAAFTVNGVDRKTELAGGTANQYTFTMTAAITVVVTYEDIPVTTYLLTLTGDNMTSNPTAGQVASGTSVTVTVSPTEGKRVATFTVNDIDRKTELAGGTANQYTFNMTAATTVVVTYEDIPVLPPNYGLRDDEGVNLPTLTYNIGGTDITKKGTELGTSIGDISTFKIKGASLKIWKTGDGNVTGTSFKYKVWENGKEKPASYTVVNAGKISDDGSIESTQLETWGSFESEINILSGLNVNKVYNIEVLFDITGTGVEGITSNGPFNSTFKYVGTPSNGGFTGDFFN